LRRWPAGSRWRVLVLAALPGLLLAVVALAGWASTLRDLPSYFAPLRERTAAALRGERGAFWNPDVGCGEPYLANPQTGVVYPLAWPALVLPGPRAVTFEAGLHLAILAAGCAMLARRLGARVWLQVAAGWGAALSGPIIDSVGVLNNLDTVAWLPWLWSAALGTNRAAIAGSAALAYLGGEPQLAVLGVAVAVIVAPNRRTVSAMALTLGLLAVQAIPFAYWVAGGDRGPVASAYDAAAGSLHPGELLGLAVPGMPMPARELRYVAHLLLPAWVLVLGAGACANSHRPVRRLAWVGWAALAGAVLAGVPGLSSVWSVVTAGLVRFPSRLVFLAVVALTPVAAATVGRFHVRPWLAGTIVLALTGAAWLRGGARLEAVVQGVTAAAVVAAPSASLFALLGAGWLAPRDIRTLALRSSPQAGTTPCLVAQQAQGGRVYVVAPSDEQLGWVVTDPETRMAALGWGYTSLGDGRRMARTFAPLQSRHLTEHLGEADQGPRGRWWLDALAARSIVSHRQIPGFRLACAEAGVLVYENRAAWPELAVISGSPRPGQPLALAGTVKVTNVADQDLRVAVRVDTAGGRLMVLQAPDPGWRFAVDGVGARPELHGGIIQTLPLTAEARAVVAHYSPPGFTTGCLASLLSVALLVALWRLERRGSMSSCCQDQVEGCPGESVSTTGGAS
jgi:hypothetical protein